ncbi:MAG: radical SAM protein [Desulfuromonas thiophila]|jgi:anaerobic magnesium-protoporphyrin IX monomethyl ester cyclase|nr:DUF4080 domain-containing protein [Desulfuromonas thiophila]MDY0397242.1 radical SAM protein [Desulfuromonas thiophila]
MHTLLTTLHSKFIHPSLALPYLAAYCGTACGTIEIVEATVHEPRDNLLALLLQQRPDVIAFSVYLWNREETLALVDALHLIRPELRLVLGGPEVSYEQQELWRHPGIRAIVRGEGEAPLRALLHSWQHGEEPQGVARLSLRRADGSIAKGPDGPPLADLDTIPSPFAQGLVDCQRGFVYYETSRGCPYRCAFCMSALDHQVRSFSPTRIEADLLWLLRQRVPKIKLVDRTFNYDAARARELFAFILRHNQGSHLHFEIGAHLLDDDTLQLLRQVPAETFQFEIGVQSCLPDSLRRVQRHAPFDQLSHAVRFLRQHSQIHLHLDLIAGLPGESFEQICTNIDQVLALQPHHLQIEPLKLLPGAPLRQQATALGLRFDPHPPYSVLATPDLDFSELERLRGLSRLLDLTWNQQRGRRFLQMLQGHHGSASAALLALTDFFQSRQLLRFPLSGRGLFEQLANGIEHLYPPPLQTRLLEALCADYADAELVSVNNLPDFCVSRRCPADDPALNAAISECVDSRLATLRGQGIKLQYLALHLPAASADDPARPVHLFFYLSGKGRPLRIEHQRLAWPGTSATSRQP